MSKTLKIFACGGSACNIAAALLRERKETIEKEAGINLEVVLVDSSDSNFKKYELLFTEHDVPLYRIPDMDGAGQQRSNMRPELIKPHLDLVLNQHGPRDINIVLHSCSGGSGSMIGPLLTRKLLEKGAPTIVSMIGDTTTQNFTKNTADSLATYDNISRNVINAPIVATYHENTPGVLHDRINTLIVDGIIELAVLFSGHIHGVDTKDLHNLLNYTNIAQVSPELSLIRTTKINSDDFTPLIQTLARSRVVAMARVSNRASSIDIPCSFRIEGTLSSESTSNEILNRIYTVEQGYFVHEVQRQRDLVNQYQVQAAALSSKKIELSNADSDGMIY